MAAIVVITTVGTQEQANLIAEELVGRRQAACVNILAVARLWLGQVDSFLRMPTWLSNRPTGMSEFPDTLIHPTPHSLSPLNLS